MFCDFRHTVQVASGNMFGWIDLAKFHEGALLGILSGFHKSDINKKHIIVEFANKNTIYTELWHSTR